MFILAKSRLAPLKERLLTILKLELQAAVIAVRIKRQCNMRLVSSQEQYFFGLTQKLSFDIFKMRKVTFQCLLCIDRIMDV